MSAFYVSQRKIASEFEILEDEQSSRNVSRMVEAIQQDVRMLVERVGGEWATWDDAYNFVASPNKEFIESNLSFEVLNQVNFSHVGYLNEEGKLVYGVMIDKQKERTAPLPDDVVRRLVEYQVLSLKDDKAHDGASGGFLRVNDELYMVAWAPITNSAGTAPSRGTVFFMRPLGDGFLNHISKVTRLRLAEEQSTLKTAAKEGASARGIDYTQSFSEPEFRKSKDSVVGSLHVLDIFGEPLMNIRGIFPRDIYKRGAETAEFIYMSVVAIFFVALVGIMTLIRVSIVNPIRSLVRQLARISETARFAERVTVESKDEIGWLGSQINGTLSSLECALKSAELARSVAEAADAAKSSFIAKVSHELRTPIHSITGMLRILLKEERSTSKRNYIMMARNAAYGLLETINEILDFSKADAGKLVLERVEFSLHHTIREAMLTIGPRVEEKGSLETVVEVPQGIPSRVWGDPLRLKQILVNLLGNATKFTKQGHVGLTVGIKNQDSSRIELELTVFDTGVGIPADRINHIFEPFRQADESVSRVFSGTGLGLTIVKQFLEAMGGSITVESELNQGSRFILTIPFEVCADAYPVVFIPETRSRQVALLDGDSAVIKRMAAELKAYGYTPTIFSADESEELERLSRGLEGYDFMLVTSEALKRSRVFDFVVDPRTRRATQVVSILSSFEIGVRERLLALEIPYVVTRPISLLDILGIISGEVELGREGWDDAEDSSLQFNRPMRVLVADDAQTNRTILTELLRDAGHQVVCVENGVELVDTVEASLLADTTTEAFDVVLTDVQMPLLDGLSATSRIREFERNRGIVRRLPIVAVTAHAMTEETSRMHQYGVDDVVTKPIDPMKLGDVILRVTGHCGQKGATTGLGMGASLSESELMELGARCWSQLAKRDKEVGRVFRLSEEPSSAEDFQRVLDIGDVFTRSGNSARRTLLIFRGFLECFREQVGKLSAARKDRDSQNLLYASHALKGLLLDVGARLTADLASVTEQQAKVGDMESARRGASLLIKQVLLVSRLIEQLVSAAGEPSSPSRAQPAIQGSLDGGVPYEVN